MPFYPDSTMATQTSFTTMTVFKTVILLTGVPLGIMPATPIATPSSPAPTPPIALAF